MLCPFVEVRLKEALKAQFFPNPEPPERAFGASEQRGVGFFNKVLTGFQRFIPVRSGEAGGKSTGLRAHRVSPVVCSHDAPPTTSALEPAIPSGES